ncbi:hypothetical protein [Streptomyces deccanensis]|uniref:hypothetical protein n=1 Tax=Streptomyces deccanensis TaxID=424188 RepID=UPI001EFAD298|nr:hypothetical protein [Streptomyces deccanensis]ULR53934.1 hypothetical protein L3078_34245 [Streptomyces deccanensis]
MSQQQYQLIATGMTGDADDLVRRVRGENPSARELDKIAAAHASHSGVWHRLWLNEQAGVLLFLERAASGNGATGGLKLHQIPLHSTSCTRVLTRLTAAVLARLASPADSYQGRPEARPDVDRDIGALVQLFRVQLARMRTDYSHPNKLWEAVHAQIERAGDEQRATLLTAFLGWYLENIYPDDVDGYNQAERDLGYDGEEGPACGYIDPRFEAKAIRDWRRYRHKVRYKAPQPKLESVPSERHRRRRGNKHWYYEFRALGRHLTEHQMLKLRAKLPGADVSSDSLVLDQWTDWNEHPIFGTEDELIPQYFDAGLRFSQEGSRTLWLRLPATLAHQIAPYEDRLAVTTTIVGDDLLVKLHRLEEDGELSYLYHDPRPWLEELLPLRDDLAGGDVRAPAIAWRASNVTRAYTEAPEWPPMPDGLDEDERSPQLQALVRLLEETP